MRIRTCICCLILMVLCTFVFQIQTLHTSKHDRILPESSHLNNMEKGFKSKIAESMIIMENCIKDRNPHCYEREGIEDDNIMIKPYQLADQAVFPLKNYKVLHSSTKICSDNPNIMIAIYPSIDQYMYRYVIRQTLRKVKLKYKMKFEIAFFMGKSANNNTLDEMIISEEASKYNDIVQFSTPDNFISKATTHVLSFLWLQNNCQSIAYYINLDIRTFINVEYIINKERGRIQKSNKGKDTAAFGEVIENEAPNRDPYHRKSIFKEIYFNNIYPPYLTNRLSIWPAKSIDSVLYIINIYIINS